MRPLLAIAMLLLVIGCSPAPKKIVHKGDIPLLNVACKVDAKTSEPTCVCLGPVALAWDAKGHDVVICSKTEPKGETK